jgi:hypothetical protein
VKPYGNEACRALDFTHHLRHWLLKSSAGALRIPQQGYRLGEFGSLRKGGTAVPVVARKAARNDRRGQREEAPRFTLRGVSAFAAHHCRRDVHSAERELEKVAAKPLKAVGRQNTPGSAQVPGVGVFSFQRAMRRHPSHEARGGLGVVPRVDDQRAAVRVLHGGLHVVS